MQNYSLRKGISLFSNRTFITIAAFVVFVIIAVISIMFAWDWFRGGGGLPNQEG